RQRVSIARALYADPKVLFLDEASSALDEATEAEIMSELRRLMDGMTILAITHRKSVIGPDDQVIVLEGTSAPETESEHEDASTGQDRLWGQRNRAGLLAAGRRFRAGGRRDGQCPSGRSAGFRHHLLGHGGRLWQ